MSNKEAAPRTCPIRVFLLESGEMIAKPTLSKDCADILNRLNPRRGEFWKLHIPDADKEKLVKLGLKLQKS